MRPFSVEALPAGAAADGEEHRRARPHQGAGRDRRAAVSGRDHRADGRLHGGQGSDGELPEGHRRPLRPVVEGVHAGDGGARFRGAEEARLRRTTSPSASTTTSPTPAWTTIRRSPPKSRRLCAPCSTDWAPTARWARTRTPSRSSAKRPTLNVQGYFVYDSKKSGAVTISHLRFSKKPIRSTYLISRANFVACHQFSFMERLGRAEGCRSGRGLPAQQPVRPRRSVGQPAALGAAGRSSTKKLKFYVIDAVEVARRPAWAAASTPSCRPASSPSAACCRATKPSPPSSTPSRRPTASAASPSCARTSPPWILRSRICTR